MTNFCRDSGLAGNYHFKPNLSWKIKQPLLKFFDIIVMLLCPRAKVRVQRFLVLKLQTTFLEGLISKFACGSEIQPINYCGLFCRFPITAPCLL